MIGSARQIDAHRRLLYASTYYSPVLRSICSDKCHPSFFTCSLSLNMTPSPAAAKISARAAGLVGSAFES